MLPVQFNSDRARPCAVRDRHTGTTGRHKYRGRHRFRLTDCRQTGDRRHREHEVKDSNLNLPLVKWLTPKRQCLSFLRSTSVPCWDSEFITNALSPCRRVLLLLSPYGLLSVPSTPLRYLHITVDWTLSHQSVKKMLHTCAHRPIWWWQFLKWRTLFPVDYNFVKLIKTNHYDIYFWGFLLKYLFYKIFVDLECGGNLKKG